MKKIIILLVFVFLGITNYQAQGWEWKETTADSKIVKDMDDNVYVFSNGSLSFTIRKIDVSGTTLWTKTAIGNVSISAYKIDNTNNLILLGNLTSSTTIDTFTLLPKGAQSFFILKISPTSIVLSANVYGSPTRTFANDLFINATGDYLVGGGFTGTFNINGDSIVGDTFLNAFIIKTDSSQNLLWSEKSTLYTSSGEAFLSELVETTSGKIYATITMFGGLVELNGYQITSSSGKHLIHLNNSRNVLWSDYLHYPGSSHNTASDLQISADTAYMKEYTWTTGGSSYRIYRWTSSGTKTLKLFSIASSLGYDVANGKIYYAFFADWYTIVGYNKIGSLALDLSEVGETADSSIISTDYYSEVQYINPTSLYIGGGVSTLFVGKYNRGLTTSVPSRNESDLFKIYPNPTSGQFTLQLDVTLQKQIQNSDIIFVFDQKGNCVLRQQFSNSSTQQIDISKMAKGIYFVEVETAKERINKKIVLN